MARKATRTNFSRHLRSGSIELRCKLIPQLIGIGSCRSGHNLTPTYWTGLCANRCSESGFSSSATVIVASWDRSRFGCLKLRERGAGPLRQSRSGSLASYGSRDSEAFPQGRSSHAADGKQQAGDERVQLPYTTAAAAAGCLSSLRGVDHARQELMHVLRRGNRARGAY
jgi:hypothetical protein